MPLAFRDRPGGCIGHLRLHWDDENRAHLSRHGLSQAMVEDLIQLGEHEVLRNRSVPERRLLIGPTSRGRFLTVSIASTEERDLWRPITGWFSAPQEVRQWQEARRRREVRKQGHG